MACREAEQLERICWSLAWRGLRVEGFRLVQANCPSSSCLLQSPFRVPARLLGSFFRPVHSTLLKPLSTSYESLSMVYLLTHRLAVCTCLPNRGWLKYPDTLSRPLQIHAAMMPDRVRGCRPSSRFLTPHGLGSTGSHYPILGIASPCFGGVLVLVHPSLSRIFHFTRPLQKVYALRLPSKVSTRSCLAVSCLQRFSSPPPGMSPKEASLRLLDLWHGILTTLGL